MTACVNRKHTKKVAAVVTASLVGALSLGAAPVAAMADTGIDMLATDAAAIAQGEVTYKSGQSGDTFTYNGKAQGLVPTSLKPVLADAVDLELLPAPGEEEAGSYYYYYVKIDSGSYVATGASYKNSDGKSVAVKGTLVKDANGAYCMPSGIGTYAVVSGRWTGSTWEHVSTAAMFTITGQSLKDATIFQGDDVNDTVFNYTGESGKITAGNWNGEIGVAIDGKPLDTTEYTVKLWAKGGSAAITSTDELVPGTTYVAKITGFGSVYGGQYAEKEFVLQKLDLSTSAIVGKVLVDNGATAPSNTFGFDDIVDTLNGVDASGIDMNKVKNDINIEFVSDPDGNMTSGGNKGAYTYKLTAKSDSKYVSGSATVQVMFANFKANIKFGNAATDPDSDGTFNIDLNEDKPDYFNLSEIEITYAAGAEVPSEGYKIVVTDANGNEVAEDALKNPGTYYVRVMVAYDDENSAYVAGSAIAKVVNEYNVTASTGVFMSYDGENVDRGTSDYFTGEDLSEKMAFLVKAGNKELVEGTDYTVTVEKQQSDGKWAETDEVVNAGNYRITVKGITYSGDDTTFTFLVMPMELKSAQVINDLTMNPVTGDGVLSYTGEVLTPSYVFVNQDGDKVEGLEGSYTVEYIFDKTDKEADLQEVGKYIASFDNTDDVENYDFSGVADTTVIVSDKGVFLDVPTNEWYSQVVYDAVSLSYMNGYSNSKMFGPNDSITRGQVACVLFNMAGGTAAYPSDDFEVSGTNGYITGFDDVDGNEYYAQAIAWAKATGVVNGYGDGTFKPEQAVTREEFAAMLSNYATKMGDDVEGAEADLSAYGDASQISDWAIEAVEWAVANEVMGNGGFIAPTAPISRAEAAAMAVNYQPEKLDQVVIEIPSFQN